MNDITKLPKWAQEHIRELQRQRDTAVRHLEEFKDDQTESPWRTSDYLCLGGANKARYRYFQADHLEVRHGGVVLEIYLKRQQGSIELQWKGQGRLSEDVICQPRSFQHVALFLPAKD